MTGVLLVRRQAGRQGGQVGVGGAGGRWVGWQVAQRAAGGAQLLPVHPAACNFYSPTCLDSAAKLRQMQKNKNEPSSFKLLIGSNHTLPLI